MIDLLRRQTVWSKLGALRARVTIVTGPRQSGKTTLVRSQLAHGTLRSLGDQGTVDAALGDPSGFLAFGQHGMRVFALAGMAEMMHYMADGAFGDVSMRVGDDLVATAEIRRPPDNFFDAGLIAALADAYEWAGKAGARAIMLCSEGKHFCAGADFTGRSSAGRVGGSGSGDDRGNGRGSTARTLYDQALRLFESPLPVVAAVQGAAVGGGLGLACSADFRVASPQARFAANFARLGLHQGFALSATLPAIVGQQHAWDLLYTGRRIGGDEAAAIGLADRLADAAGLREAAHALAAQLAESAPLAIRAIRATMREGLAARVRDAMDHELAEQEKLWPTADFAEGVRATAERRTPRFEGR